MKKEVYAVKVEDFLPGEEQTNLLVELSILQSYPHERLVKFCGAAYLAKSLNAGAKVCRDISPISASYT